MNQVEQISSGRRGPREVRWYALFLRSRFEKKVDKRLRENGVLTFLPMVEEIHSWSDRKQKVFEPLFQGYLFVRTDLRDRMTILETDGVVRFVGSGRIPSVIPDVEIDGIRIVVAQPAKVRREEFLPKGQRVKVISGPFEGIEGIVMRSNGESRVILTVESIAQSVSVFVPEAHLQKI